MPDNLCPAEIHEEQDKITETNVLPPPPKRVCSENDSTSDHHLRTSIPLDLSQRSWLIHFPCMGPFNSEWYNLRIDITTSDGESSHKAQLRYQPGPMGNFPSLLCLQANGAKVGRKTDCLILPAPHIATPTRGQTLVGR